MRLFGHPVHPILVAFPIALLGVTPVLDILALAGVMANASTVAYVCQIGGLIGGGLAAITGLIDFVRIPQSEKAAAKAAIVHASLAFVMLALFGLAFALRGEGATSAGPLVIALEVAGAAVLAGAGWFGGHLVFGYGIGVERKAAQRT